jgi:hypothetical protein
MTKDEQGIQDLSYYMNLTKKSSKRVEDIKQKALKSISATIHSSMTQAAKKGKNYVHVRIGAIFLDPEIDSDPIIQTFVRETIISQLMEAGFKVLENRNLSDADDLIVCWDTLNKIKYPIKGYVLISKT